MIDLPLIEAGVSTGEQLRYWRRQRGWSQEDLAEAAEISTRHLSFIETGRARPSADLLMRLAGALDLSYRQGNALLIAGGFAAPYPSPSLDDAALRVVQEALAWHLRQHEPYPAVVVDGGYEALMFNRGFELLLRRFQSAPELATERNLYRLIFHPQGLRRFCPEWEQISGRLLARLHDEAIQRHDSMLWSLYRDCRAYYPAAIEPPALNEPELPVLTFSLMLMDQHLRFLSTVTAFGSALDVTTQELRIESFFPADEATRAFFAPGALPQPARP